MKLFCQAGKHEWERPPQRGRPPLNCPEHAKAKPERQAKPERPAENPAKRMARLRDIKAQRERERAELAREAEQQRRTQIVESLPELQAAYERAFDSGDFTKADQLQAKIIYAAKLSRVN